MKSFLFSLKSQSLWIIDGWENVPMDPNKLKKEVNVDMETLS